MAYSYKNKNGAVHMFLIIAGILCFLLASSVIPFFSGESSNLPSADILLCFVCTLTAFTDTKKAAIYAVCLGFLADLFVFPPTNFSPVVFLACVYASHFFQGYFSRIGTLAVAISSLPCSLLKILVSTCVMAVNAGAAASKSLFITHFPMEIVVNFACAIVLTFVMRILCAKLNIRTDN